MRLRNTLIPSVLLHLCFFAAFLFMSAVSSGRNDLIQRNGGRTPDEKVFFVKLLVEADYRSRVVSTYREDKNNSGNEQPVFETRKPGSEKSRQVKVQKTLPFEIQDIAVSVDSMRKQSFFSHGVETDEAGENNNDLNEQEETADNALLASYETVGDGAIDISYTRETAASVSHGSFSPADRGKPEGYKGGESLPTGIFDLIRDSIEKVKTYPILARKRGIEGTVHISFRISPNGEPQDLRILKSSGSSILDAATLDTVKKAVPFPYVDSPIEVPVVYRLSN